MIAWLLCKIFGHQWRLTEYEGYVHYVCARCGEIA